MLRTKKGRTDGRVDYYMPPFGSIKSIVSEIQIFKAPSMCNSMNAFEAVAQFSPGLLLCQTGRRKRLLIKSKHFQLIPSGLLFAHEWKVVGLIKDHISPKMLIKWHPMPLC